MSLLEQNIQAIRQLQRAGRHLARLASYIAIGVQPSREHMVNAQRWFNEASSDVEPALQQAESERASQRIRNSMRG